MPMTTSDFPVLLYPGLRKAHEDFMKGYPELYTRYVNKETTDMAFVKDAVFAGMPLAARKNENKSIFYANIIQGYVPTYTVLTYGLGYIVTVEMLQFDQYGVIAKMNAQLAKSMARSPDQILVSMLDRAYNTAYPTATGQPVCSLTQPLIGGGTTRNRLSTLASLSATSLEQAMTDMKYQVNHRGIVTGEIPKKLLIPSALEFQANLILGSNNSQRAIVTGTTDAAVSVNINALNPIKDRVEIVALPYMQSTTAWFLQAEEHNLNIFWAKSADHNEMNQEGTRNKLVDSIMMFGYGAGDWPGMFGGNS